jgi:hypothetical protein
MSSSLLPVWFDRASATLIFALGIYLVAVHTVLAALAAERSALSRRSRALVPFFVGLFLATWLGIGIMSGDGRNFASDGDGLDRSLAIAIGFGPLVVAIALLFFTRTMRAIDAATPPDWLIRVQIYRAAGFMFLFPFLYYGVLPAGFAIPAAVGDFLTGIAAPTVARHVAERRPGAFKLARAWNLFGIADLIVAPTAAVLTHAQVFAIYPLVLVPLFIGPPLGILTHIHSLRNLATAFHSTPESPSTSPSAVGVT